jgi:hypothetical protein
MGDEAYFHSDGQNFYFIIVRIGKRLFRIKVNKVTSHTSLNEFKRVSKKNCRWALNKYFFVFTTNRYLFGQFTEFSMFIFSLIFYPKNRYCLKPHQSALFANKTPRTGKLLSVYGPAKNRNNKKNNCYTLSN